MKVNELEISEESLEGFLKLLAELLFEEWKAETLAKEKDSSAVCGGRV